MNLLEREPALATLRDAATEARSGQGRVALVTGEAGIGKTSVADALVRGLDGTMAALWGGCDALFTPRPLAPLHDIALQLPETLADKLDAGAPRASVFSAFLRHLQANPAVVVIEDVHWADDATLDLVKFLARRIQRLPVLLVLTYRDDEVGAAHPLRFVIGELPPRVGVRIALSPLSREAVGELAGNVERRELGDDLYRATGGNPFYVTEVLASESAGVPASVRDAVLARAARLSPPARAVLELASVIPGGAASALIDACVPDAAAALDECVARGMLREADGVFAFRHEIARRAIETGLPPARARALHARVLEAMRAHREGDAALAQLVHHALKAGDGAAVLELAPRAALHAASLSAHREAAAHYASALSFAGALDPVARAALHEGHAYECYLTSQIGAAIAARTEALALWRQVGRRDKEGESLRWLSRLAWFEGQGAEPMRRAIEAIDVLESIAPGPELAMAYSNRAQLHALAQQADDAVRWGTKAIELARRFGATEIVVHALNNVGAARVMSGDTAGREQLAESLRLALEHDLPEHVARAYTNLGSGAGAQQRDYAFAQPHLDAGIAYCIERDLDSWTLYMRNWRARMNFDQGRWTAATQDAEAVVNAPHATPVSRVGALAVLGHVRVRRGDPGAGPLLDEARALADGTGELQRIAPVALARAEMAWLDGDRGRTLAEVREPYAMAVALRNRWEGGALGFWQWRCGEPVSTDGWAGVYALQSKGDWRGAADEWARLGCPYERALALADGDDAACFEALEIFAALGAAPAAAQLRERLRQRGVRAVPRGPRASTRENAFGLTPREIDILGLLALELSNAEIAARLHRSPKTIDHHVSAVIDKLNVRSRQAAVQAAREAGLLSAK